jgi:hypothetical protein
VLGLVCDEHQNMGREVYVPRLSRVPGVLSSTLTAVTAASTIPPSPAAAEGSAVSEPKATATFARQVRMPQRGRHVSQSSTRRPTRNNALLC